jgi:hypothetical protein
MANSRNALEQALGLFSGSTIRLGLIDVLWGR